MKHSFIVRLVSGWGLFVTSEHVGKSLIVSFTFGTLFYIITFSLRGDALAHTFLFIELKISTTVLNVIYL